MSSHDRIRLIGPLFAIMRRRRWWWIALSLYVVGIFLVPTLAAHSGTAAASSLDKVYHAAEYFGLAVLATTAARQRSRAFLLCVLIAVVDEAHQLLLPLRQADVLDLAADAAGIVLGFASTHAVLLWCRARRILAKRRSGKDK